MSEFVAKHMSAGYKCDEPTCEYKSNHQTMKWCREGLECLFDQQIFWRNILDVENALGKLTASEAKSARMRPEFAETRNESIGMMNLTSVIIL
ncbi:unnamed protein product [Caenorhabditis angaria]|uniref:Uncharacterized protein n=1 Tax=Caenorhabditis angaria TaxID=860376 RepID=A0A9P1IJ59_9PELO|nr:unnamed protein product [Caenorhabditis angaria]